MNTSQITLAPAAPAAEDPTTEAAPLDRLAYVPGGRDWRTEITLDLADSSWYVRQRHQSENSYPFYEWHGHAVSYALQGNADASRFAEWMAAEVAPVLARIQDGYESAWDGSNNVARLNEDAREAREELDALFAPDVDVAYPTLSDESGGLWDAPDWLDGARADILREHGITAETTDARLYDVADVLDEEARGEDVKLDGTFCYLEGLRDDLAARESDDLMEGE